MRKRPHRRERPMPASDEIKFVGRAACFSLLRHRIDDVVRLFSSDLGDPELAPFLEQLANRRKVYREVPEIELEKISKSTHHQGLVVVAKPKPETTWNQLLANAKNRRPRVILALDGVENPHNFGAILRSAAHFGVDYVLGAEKNLPKLSAAAARTAEGGGEAIAIVRAPSLTGALRELRKLGYKIYLAEKTKGSRPLHEHRFDDRSVIVMGNEVHGISADLRSVADGSLEIAGTGAVESLNVSVATAVLLAELDRQARLRTPSR